MSLATVFLSQGYPANVIVLAMSDFEIGFLGLDLLVKIF